jgi:hypothetical protein
MATINSDQYLKGVVGSGPAGNLKVLFGSTTFASAPSAADIVNMFTIPKGFIPMFGWLVGDDIDTGTEALELDVGVTGDTTKFLNSGVITGDTIANEKITVGIKIPLQEDLMTVKPTAMTADTDCIVTVTAAANAGGTGTITVYLCGVYNDGREV